jgi:hypothetical protein
MSCIFGSFVVVVVGGHQVKLGLLCCLLVHLWWLCGNSMACLVEAGCYLAGQVCMC